ncbi:MAG TPA: ferrous iron transport protein A [Gemmataceae bacterium]|jgi:ferrous iron transport protein A|nr:ferrous iron transport protein A [Gemmataceae bacterium]
MLTLDQLRIGEKGQIQNVSGEPALVQRLLEMGLLEGEVVQVLAVAPLGDPIEISFGFSRVSLRRREAAGIQLERI